MIVHDGGLLLRCFPSGPCRGAGLQFAFQRIEFAAKGLIFGFEIFDAPYRGIFMNYRFVSQDIVTELQEQRSLTLDTLGEYIELAIKVFIVSVSLTSL